MTIAIRSTYIHGCAFLGMYSVNVCFVIIASSVFLAVLIFLAISLVDVMGFTSIQQNIKLKILPKLLL